MNVGKRIGGFLYVHRDALSEMDPSLSKFAEKAFVAIPDAEWNVLKVSRKKVSLLLYEDFDRHAFPALLHSATVDVEKGTVIENDYSKRENPPILHRKELFLPTEDPRIPQFRSITRLAEEKGLFINTTAIGTRTSWGRLLTEAGLKIVGPSLVPSDANPISVAREKTAIPRSGWSKPMRLMLDFGMVTRDTTVFDYGCGLGGDLELLTENGYDAFGWDPNHRPDGPRQKADIVNLGFVVNVIEDRYERDETLNAAWSFARKGMTISTMHLSQADVAGHMPHGDGFISRRQTFQKYFTQQELLDWVQDVLGERPISLGQAVVAVFKDKDLEQQVAFERRSKASIITSMLKIARPPKQFAPVQLALSARLIDEIDAIWQAALFYGRVPTLQELGYEVSNSLAGKRVSFARALQACARKYDFGALADVATARKEDLIVNGALSLFPGAPKYGSLPASMQRDIRQFFGSNTAFRDVCFNALGALRDPDNLQEAFASAVAGGVATTDGVILRFSMSQEARLPTALRIMVGCAEFVRPGFTQVDAVEIGPKPSQVKGYVCNDFSVALPKILEILEIDLGRSKSRTVRKDDSILYLKSRFMANDDNGRSRQEVIDGRLVVAGVVTVSGLGPKGAELSALLKNLSAPRRSRP